MIYVDPLHVRTAAGTALWRVEYELGDYALDEPWRLSVIEPEGRRYEAVGLDLYVCLRKIRRHTDREGILLCCNGARKNASPSGYGSSAVGALSIYTDHRWRGPLPQDLVGLFDYAPPSRIVTVEEQEVHLEKVHRYLRSNVSLLNPLLYVTAVVRALYYWVRFARMRRLNAKADRLRGTAS